MSDQMIGSKVSTRCRELWYDSWWIISIILCWLMEQWLNLNHWSLVMVSVPRKKRSKKKSSPGFRIFSHIIGFKIRQKVKWNFSIVKISERREKNCKVVMWLQNVLQSTLFTKALPYCYRWVRWPPPTRNGIPREPHKFCADPLTPSSFCGEGGHTGGTQRFS